MTLAAVTGLMFVAPAAAQIPQIAPDVQKLTVTPKRFKALAKGPAVVAKGGGLVTFTLDTGSNVDFRVSALKPGKRTAAGCVAGKATMKAKQCTRVVDHPRCLHRHRHPRRQRAAAVRAAAGQSAHARRVPAGRESPRPGGSFLVRDLPDRLIG